MTKVRIGSIVDLSTIDWYGKVTSVVFFAGCNFRCPYCQNASLIPVESGNEASTECLFERIESNLGVADAVGFTGGEPCLQTEALRDLAERAKGIGLKVFLNTNGSNPRIISTLLKEGLLDYVALDLKAPLRPEMYSKVTNSGLAGIDAARDVGSTLDLCLEERVTLEIRTTIVPGLIDGEKDIRDVARRISGADLYVLQQFRPEGDIFRKEYRELAPPSRARLRGLAMAATGCGIKEIRIRTKEQGEERIWP